jgi:hypothetical protein
MCGREKKCRQEVLVGKLEGKRPTGRPSRKWEYNIKMYFREIELKGLRVDWIHSAQDREKEWNAVNVVLKMWFCKIRRII